MFMEKNVLIDSIYKTVVDFYFKVQLINQFIKDKKKRPSILIIYYFIYTCRTYMYYI